MSELPKSVILFQIKVHLKLAMLEEVRMRKEGITSGDEFEKAVAHKTVSRSIISMFPEIGKKPDEGTDDDVIKLLKKYISQEKERALYQFGHLKESDIEGKSAPEIKKLVSNTTQKLGGALTNPFIEIAEEYLPEQASEEEITEWIRVNIDLTKLKNKMQAMGPIMNQFKGCDGNVVKNILLKM